MRLSRRAAVLTVALVPLGTIGGHVAGYVLAGQRAGLDGSHSHLSPAAWLTALTALMALGWMAGARGARPARLPVAWLAAGQAALFVALESVEHLVGGHGLRHLLSEPAVRWGLVAQVATAAVLAIAAVVARASGDRVRALLAARTPGVGRPAAVDCPAVTGDVRSLTLASCATERGPPRILASV